VNFMPAPSSPRPIDNPFVVDDRAYRPPREPKRRWRFSHFLVGLIALALGGYWLTQAIRKGSFVADPSGLTQIMLTRPANGERDVLPNTFVQAELNAGHALDPDTLDAATVKLYRSSDQLLIPSRINTSGGNDDIVLTPLVMLDPGTQYTFEVKGVKDTTGADVFPFKMSFTTSGGASTEQFPVAFEKFEAMAGTSRFTSLAIGPDHKLYAGTGDGTILRCNILPDGALGAPQEIPTIRATNRDRRLITGLAFDPKSTAVDPVLWVSHGQFVVSQSGEPVGARDWTGKISVLTGPALEQCRDAVVNLPRSLRDHLNNQCVFGPDGALYWSQGSHTAMGAPDTKWGRDRTERLLSAAILRLDPSRLKDDQTLDAKTPEGGGKYDPFAPGAPLRLYATGVRVSYDLLWHSNGKLYAATNGSSANGNVPATPSDRKHPRRLDGRVYDGGDVIGMTIPQTQPDLLLKVEKGGYYGHPNPLRAEYVLNGGNPTSKIDPFEVAAYPVGVKPDVNWRPPIYSFGASNSPNGMVEFRSSGKLFKGMLDGKILVTRFSGGKDIMVLSLDHGGNVVETITGIAGLTDFNQPLDLVEDESTGNLYVAEYAGEKLALLKPITDDAKLAETKQTVFRQQVHPAGAAE
jgi:glucose/arabinose dehydrogenase